MTEIIFTIILVTLVIIWLAIVLVGAKLAAESAMRQDMFLIAILCGIFSVWCVVVAASLIYYIIQISLLSSF